MRKTRHFSIVLVTLLVFSSIAPLYAKKKAKPNKKTKKKAAITKQTIAYWTQTMEFGTPAQKKEVLKQIRYIKKKVVADILLNAYKYATEESLKKLLIQIFYERKEKRVLPLLIKNLEQAKDPQVLASILATIGKLQAKKASLHIYKFLKHENAEVLKAAIDTLGILKDKTIGKKLLEMLDNAKTDKEVKYNLVIALGRIAYKPAFKTLRRIALNKSNKRFYRGYAVYSLGQLKIKKILPVFFKILSKEKVLPQALDPSAQA